MQGEPSIESIGRTAEQGFTLIELMIVVSIIAIIASIAVPNLVSARKSANENTTIAALKNLASAQSQISARAAVDVDHNGAGEFGFFGELAGVSGIRDASGGASTEFLRPAILSGGYGRIQAGGISGGGVVSRSGYFIQIFLPDATGNPMAEGTSGGIGSGIPSPSKSSNYWCAYAWPISGASGQRCFFINQAGDILAARNQTTRYFGSTNPPAFNSAFDSASAGLLTSTVAANAAGLDGQNWLVVQ